MPGYKAYVKQTMQRGQLVSVNKGSSKYTGVVVENSFLQADHGRVEVDAVVKLKDDENRCYWIIPFGSAMDLVICIPFDGEFENAPAIPQEEIKEVVGNQPVDDELKKLTQQVVSDEDEKSETEDGVSDFKDLDDHLQNVSDENAIEEIDVTDGEGGTTQQTVQGVTSQTHQEPKTEKPTAAELSQRKKSNKQEHDDGDEGKSPQTKTKSKKKTKEQ